MGKSFFTSEGNWYKGTAHAHTNLSDGRLSPRELTDLYKANGYDFMAITDHCVYGDHSDLEEENFIILPGVELDTHLGGLNTQGKTICHHIVGLGIPGQNTFSHGHPFLYEKNQYPVSELIRLLRDNGNLCIYAHPYWSHLRHEELDGIDGLHGIEVYNNTCEVICGAGDASTYLDRLLFSGREIFCFASDDTHQHTKDYFGGFIYVKAPGLTRESVMDAIQKGHFYASTGPQITDFYIEDGKAVAHCSPCRKIVFQGDSIFGAARNDEDAGLTHHEYQLTGTESYLRVICEDLYGKKAWSQPVWLDRG